ncbi:MAG TPA: phage major capsid protein [Gemmatimonadaceae bacterium]|nr:phage major capsid protein [Gemmatimonadaceae bacterium]
MPEEAKPLPRLVELRDKLTDLRSEILNLTEQGVLDEGQTERYEDLVNEHDAIEPEYRKLEERAARAEEIKKNVFREISGMPEVRKPADEYLGRDVTRMDYREARDGALRILSDREQNFILSPHQQDVMDKLVRSNPQIARRVLVTENDAYRSAFMKATTTPSPIYTHEEHEALLRFNEFRAQDEGATTHGGFAIPVFIDPSVILTDQETDNPFLTLARQETINTNAWKGVSAAGVSWSFDAEGTATSDDSITLAQPSVTVFMARGFIPYSIEVGEDWPGFQSEMARLLAAGYDELLVDKFSRGSGTGEPMGVVTALDATAGSEVLLTTAGQFGQEDVYNAWKNLPQKYRRRAAWMMNVGVMGRIRQFGSSNVYHAYTVNLPAGAVEELFARPVYESPYFADFTATTAHQNVAVVGDWSNYVVARRSGMSVELVPTLFDVTNNRPTGQRGWFAYGRIGGGVVNTAGFRLLNQT